MTPEQQIQQADSWLRLRDKGRTDLFWLANEVLSPPDSRIMVHHAHDCIVNHCQKFKGRIELLGKHGELKFKNGVPVITHSVPRVEMWDLEGDRNNLLLVSRGFLKTTIHTVAHIIQWIINYPDVRILMVTSTDEKAQIIVGKIKQHFQFNPLFRFLYPEVCPDAKKVSDWGSRTEFSVPCRRKRGDEPTVMTAAVGKALASTHHDVIKCSDVVTENNINTRGQIEEVIEFFGYLESLRERGPVKPGADPEGNPGWKDVEGTIYDWSDYYCKILDHVQTQTENKTWKITKQSCWVDKAKTISLWPERFPPKELKRIYESPEVGPVLFSSQYELDPIRAEDGLASLEQIRFFPAHLIAELTPRYRIHTTVDLAGMDPQTEGDSTVFSTVGFDNDGRCDVLSIVKGRFTLDRVIDLFFAVDKVYPSNLSFKVQKDHFSRTIWPILQREQAKRGKWLNIILTPVSTRVSKQQRIRGLQAWFLQGIIRFADNISCRNELVLEILRFPKYEHDDILDTLADQMHNRDGQPSVDVYPDSPKGYFGMPQGQNKFVEFDPITKQEKWLNDAIESATPFYHSITGAL